MNGDASPMLLDLTGKTSLMASNDSGSGYGSDTGIDSSPISTPSEIDEAEVPYPLIQIETEEESLSVDSSTGPSENYAQ